jgi:hypothetical protein
MNETIIDQIRTALAVLRGAGGPKRIELANVTAYLLGDAEHIRVDVKFS